MSFTIKFLREHLEKQKWVLQKCKRSNSRETKFPRTNHRTSVIKIQHKTAVLYKSLLLFCAPSLMQKTAPIFSREFLFLAKHMSSVRFYQASLDTGLQLGFSQASSGSSTLQPFQISVVEEVYHAPW